MSATILASDGFGIEPSGTVTFYDGTAVIYGPVTLPAGSTEMQFSPALTEGVHQITAIYSGDTNFPGATSPVYVQTIGQNPSYNGSVSYTYDSQGRLWTATYVTPSGTTTVTYSYDNAGNRTSVVTQ